MPLVRDALELVHPSVFEHEPRTCRQVLDRRRHKELARFSETSDSSTDVHGKSADLPVNHLDFAGVHSCPHVEAKRLHSADDGSAAPHGTRGTIECGEESVSGGVDLGSPVARQESADQSVMWLDEFTPCTITQSGYSLGRADQIGEEAVARTRSNSGSSWSEARNR